jgi:hypothetical protein
MNYIHVAEELWDFVPMTKHPLETRIKPLQPTFLVYLKALFQFKGSEGRNWLL